MQPELRSLVLRGATGEVRHATFKGRDHIVVPVVALVEGVVHPMGAEVPEFVPAEVLAKIPGGWNNRPVLTDHPVSGDQPASANVPIILESQQFGTVFNVATSEQILENKRLTFEAWLDPELAEAVGDDAISVCERAVAGDPIEVSVGAIVMVELTEGDFEAKHYGAIWRECHPDHFAMLPEGVTGACSNEMGCGLLRAAAHRITDTGIELEEQNMKQRAGPESSGMFNRLTAFLKSLGSEDETRSMVSRALWVEQAQTAVRTLGEDEMSDTEVRRALWDVLHDTEPGFDYILDVFPGDHNVVYVVVLDNEWITRRRSYAVADDNTVSLADDAVEVQETVVYEPMQQGGPDPEDTGKTPQKPADTRAACDCQNTDKGDSEMKELKERIQALIDNEATPYQAEHADQLAVCGEALVSDLEELYADPEEGEKPGAQAAPPSQAPDISDPPADPNTATIDKDELAQLRSMAARQKAVDAKRKTELVAGLKVAQDTLDDKALAAKSLDDLEVLAKMLKLDEPRRDYTGAMLGTNAEQDTSRFAPPDTYGLRAKAEAAKAERAKVN